MFSSFLSTKDPHATNLHPVTGNLPPSELYGELTSDDLNWVCASGAVTETQIWYHMLEDGTFLLCQIIHSSVGLWYPTIQFTCRIFNPTTHTNTWRSTNVSNFTTPMPGSDDKRTCKSDRFTIKFKPATATSDETYSILANPADDLQITLDVSRPSSISGFKIGKGEQGGKTIFGPDVNKPEGYVFHKFWPRTTCTGHIIAGGKAIKAEGHGMFVHAIQGMRPDTVAARWNFANFNSQDKGGVSALMMELTTTPDYGRRGAGSGGVIINVGGIVVGGKLLAVTGETRWPGEQAGDDQAVMSRAVHQNTKHDPDTGYSPPTKISYHWAGASIVADSPGTVKASLDLDLGDPKSFKGLIGKVDVLAELPKVVKAVIAYAAGTKPYIYTFLNPAKLEIVLPDGEKLHVKGTVFNEATFIS